MGYIFLIILAALVIVRLIYVLGKGYSGKQLWLHFFYHVPTHVIDELDGGYGERYQPLGSKKSAPNSGVDFDSYPSRYGCNYDPAADIPISAQDEAHMDQLLRNGGWKCTCGNVNAVYVTSCSCGRNKDGEEVPEPAAVLNAVTEDNETKNAAAIREYKQLLDDGIITAEEFEAKKKQLLGI